MTHVVICGGGYAGLSAARSLDTFAPSDIRVTLIDERDSHELLTRLPGVVSAEIPLEKARIPFSRLLSPRIERLKSRVMVIDPKRLSVATETGEVKADRLIVALGAVPGDAGVPGSKEHGLIVRSVAAAEQLRVRIRELQAPHGSGRRVGKVARPLRGAVRVAIIGAGYTGTELAGELSSGAFRELELTLIAADEVVLPGGNEALGVIAERILRKRGVRLILGTPVAEVRADAVVLQNEAEEATDIVVWAAPSVGVAIAGDGWPRRPDQRIAVDTYLRALGVEHVFVAGDLASIESPHGRMVASSAQLAVQEGRRAAENLMALEEGETPREFVPRIAGEALSLGNGDAAAEAAGVVVTGRAALGLKRAALARYLANLGGWRLVKEYL